MNSNASKFLRLLIIEDNPGRIRLLKEWLPEDIRPVFATSAGRALGVLQLDKGRVYAGIMLDHDLFEQPSSAEDSQFSGTHVVKMILRSVHPDTPIIVHSMNETRSREMVNHLESGGFYVRRIPMDFLTQEKFLDWLTEVREIWEYDQEIEQP